MDLKLGTLSLCVVALSLFASGSANAARYQLLVISDDIHNVDITLAEVVDPAPAEEEAAAPAEEPVVSRGGGKGRSNCNNNGHGNNLDGVDSSNPGQGGGGPNGRVDESGGVDDEAGTGGGKGKKK